MIMLIIPPEYDLLDFDEDKLVLPLEKKDDSEDCATVSDFWFNFVSSLTLSTKDFLRVSLSIILTGYFVMFCSLFMLNVGFPFISGILEQIIGYCFSFF